MLNVLFEKPMDQVPEDVRARLRTTLRAVAHRFATTVRIGPLARAASIGGLTVDVPPWRFRYRIDVKTNDVIVEEAELA